MDCKEFAKGAERLVDPICVGSIHFMQQMCELAPQALQRAMMNCAMDGAPRMGFVVEPYAFFMFFRVQDEVRAAKLLPSGFKLVRSSVFEGDEPEILAAMSFFRAHTSAFWGSRAEFYLMAENEATGLLSWVIVDYMSDTISYDRAHGLRGPSAPGAVVAASADGCVVVDMEAVQGSGDAGCSHARDGSSFGEGASVERGGAPSVAFSASLDGACMRPLDERMWVEGNISIAYGRALSHDRADLFSLTFPPDEMSHALDVPVGSLDVERLDWLSDIVEAHPVKLACFPFAQHTLSDSPGNASGYRSCAELACAVDEIDFELGCADEGCRRKGNGSRKGHSGNCAPGFAPPSVRDVARAVGVAMACALVLGTVAGAVGARLLARTIR